MPKLLTPALRAALNANAGLTSPEDRLAWIDRRLGQLWPAEREGLGGEALEREIRDLESERFYLWYLMHPEERSHAG